MPVQAAMAGVGARYYSRRMRQGTSDDRFPGGRLARRSAVRKGGSRTPDEARVVAVQLRKHSVAYLTALEKTDAAGDLNRTTREPAKAGPHDRKRELKPAPPPPETSRPNDQPDAGRGQGGGGEKNRD